MEKRVAVGGRNGSVSVEFSGKRFRSPTNTRMSPGPVRVRLDGGRLVVKRGGVSERFHVAERA